jgi:hypothetical protein
MEQQCALTDHFGGNDTRSFSGRQTRRVQPLPGRKSERMGVSVLFGTNEAVIKIRGHSRESLEPR